MGELNVDSITIFNSPLLSLRILISLLMSNLSKLLTLCLSHWLPLLSFTSLCLIIYYTPGPHKPFVSLAEEFFLFALWWVLLGVASSIGLGTGLHTFVLYLGPHIAKVTMVAYECGFIPEMLPSRWSYETFEDCPEPTGAISIWSIVAAVQVESFLWGLGTALGELPPYFIALAARLANKKAEELEELDENDKSLIGRAKAFMAVCLKKYGFITVLLCASIPNPLFDLAGLLCGHFGIPLWEFLGATIIGKAVIKVHIQMLFTIYLCGGKHIDDIVKFLENEFSTLGSSVSTMLAKHKKMLHSPHVDSGDKTWIASIWEYLIILMISFFLISILNSLVRSELSKTSESLKTNRSRGRKTKPKKKH